MEILFSLLFFLWSWLQPAPEGLLQKSDLVTVVRVVDGDTIDVLLNATTTRVRYIGIDTPEPYRDREPACFSRESSDKNRDLVEGREVRLVPDAEDVDKYGRLLRYVYVDEVFVNQVLLEGGYAVPLTIKPNTLHAKDFKILADKAKADKLGLWSACPS